VYFDIETTGLDISKDHIVTIQIKDGYGKKVWCRRDYRTESELIKQFVDYYLEVDDKFLIGFNITNFDLPFLFTRIAKEDLAGFFNKYNKGYVRDLATILEFHKIKRQKLENVARIYRIDVGSIEEIDVKELHENGDWNGIIAYAKNELDVIEQLFRKMWNQITRDGHLSFTSQSIKY
jgi:uncharacterized protein YprB with RNaseH-like and TPR domain